MSVLTKYGRLLARTLVKQSPYIVFVQYLRCPCGACADRLVDSLIWLTPTRSAKFLADRVGGRAFSGLMTLKHEPNKAWMVSLSFSMSLSI